MTQPFPRIERWWFRLIPALKHCYFCRFPFGVQMECSRTMYPWNGTGKDPNAVLPLCRVCAEVHHSHWDEMWLEAQSH